MNVWQAVAAAVVVLVGIAAGIMGASGASVAFQRRQDRLAVRPEPNRWHTLLSTAPPTSVTPGPSGVVEEVTAEWSIEASTERSES
jgi:hypothetical protein